MDPIGLFRTFGEALAIGLLVGVERYRDRRESERKSAGVRTFTLFALLGAVCGLLPPSYTLLTLGALVVLLGLGYHQRRSEESLGITTEAAAVLTFWLGYLIHEHESLAISTGIVLVILLAYKRSLHDFVKEQVTEIELYDTLKFLAVVFVVYPLLPEQSIGPYRLLSPTHIWLVIILVSTIGYVGYVLIRVMGSTRGLMASGIVGGTVSTTAATVSLAQRSRRTPELGRVCAAAAVSANAVQFPRLLLLVSMVNLDLGMSVALPLMGMGATGMLIAWLSWKADTDDSADTSAELVIQNPYSFTPALKFGLFLVGVILLAGIATDFFGSAGIYVTSAIAGIGDASAISLTAASMFSQGSLTAPSSGIAIFIAISMNALLKCILAWTYGTRALSIRLAGAFATMLLVGLFVGALSAG